MIPLNRTYAPLQAFVDELARCGLEHAVTSPGSRNAPLALTLAAEERVRAWSVIDERSAGFFALGLAKATGRPVAITCTSGSAAANLMPAVVEAREARVPLILLTADRPPELRDVGAGQAIDQVKLYGTAAKWFVEVGSHEPGREGAVHHRALACRAYSSARDGRPGPVHLNFPLREPLAPVGEEMDAAEWTGRPDGSPWTAVAPTRLAGDPDSFELSLEFGSTRRGAIVCGASADPGLAEGAARLARATGWPLLAEPTSGARCGAHDRSHVVSHYDVLLRDEGFAAAHRADLVLRLGDTPTSKPLRAWLAEAGEQIVVDPHLAWHEPTRSAGRLVAAEAGALCLELAAMILSDSPDGDWLDSWRRADALVPEALAAMPDPFEPRAIAALAEVLPEGATVWVASSMPVRDLEAFFPSIGTRVRFLANRGANGIDGVVSSVAGAAAARAPGRAFLITGELSLLHDVGGLVTARRAGVALTILCLNNGGGGIFDFLPVAGHADPAPYEEHVSTPSGIDLAAAAALAGLPHRTASTPRHVRDAVAAGPGLIEVRTDRAENVARHRELYARVAETLATGT